MDVFIVTTGRYSAFALQGAFSTRELAEAHRRELMKLPEHDPDDVNQVLAVTVDAWAGKLTRPLYVVAIVKKTGLFDPAQETVQTLESDGRARYQVYTDAIEVRSPQSFDHAKQVATALFSAWMRQELHDRDGYVG